MNSTDAMREDTARAAGRTIVIGAGIGGLATGHYLTKAGVECRILERAPVPGGRIQALRRGDDVVDVGTQYFHTNYVETLELLRDVGLRDQLRSIRAPVRMIRHGKGQLVKHTTVRLKTIPLLSNLRAARPIITALLNLKRIDPYFNSPLPEFEDIELSEYILDKCDRDVLEFFVRPIVIAFNQSEPEGESLAHFMRMMKQYLTASDTCLPAGMYSFPKTLADTLPVVYDAEARELVIEQGRVTGVKVRIGRDDETIAADRVVCATPLKEITPLLPGLSPDEKSVIEEYKYSKMALVVFFMKRRIPDDFWAWVFSRTEGFRAAYTSDALFKCGEMIPSGKSVLQVWYVGEAGEALVDEDEDELVALARQEMKRVLPDFDDEVESVDVVRQPTGMSRYPVGIYPRLRSLLESIKRYGGLHLVGDFYGHSTMETVVRSARRAVDEIVAAQRI
jgi:protoporphyrinogen oxidase